MTFDGIVLFSVRYDAQNDKKKKPTRILRIGFIGGNNRARTYDPLLVRQMLSQLSYAPEVNSNKIPQIF